MSEIYLIRHGEITQSSPRRFVGQSELPLTDRGRMQMLQVAEYLAGRGLSRLLCSPLSRCVESAGIVGMALGLEPKVVPDLREIGLGVWECLTMEEVQERFPDDYEARGRDLARFRPAGGESFSDLHHRAWAAFEAASEFKSPQAIVAHSGVNRVLLCRILGMPLENLFRLGQDYGCVNILRAEKGEYRIGMVNACVETRDA